MYLPVAGPIVNRDEKTTNKTERLKYDIEFHSMLYEISENTTTGFDPE